ncbi:syntaxin-71-like isoform X1 [Juglans microcarpa x Juglans regia]|uniref:syntaxin-71-like isoform X1 n=1 Tax=Juglans microcarpa x Juglans regia TaxID=2249226 RepID=UPI001B7ECB0F|nr:syntaxin-71-like isoform X1 [Juglans microcarpa x Juglans regia]
MSVIDILFRVDEICKKYEKYDIEKQRELNAYGDDAFARLYAFVESEIKTALQKSEMASTENNRASAAALNAEVRRTKARLMDEVPKLRKLALKKVKGLSKEDLAARDDLVLALPERIQAISDGITTAAKRTGGWTASSSHKNITFDSSDGNFDNDFFHQTEDSNQFRQEYEMRKMKQDQGLDVISEGLDTLKNLAQDMNEELDRQVPLIDEIDTKADRVTSEIRNTNVRLKKSLTQLRSSRNFLIDIVLLCIILGIASYLYNLSDHKAVWYCIFHYLRAFG